MNKKHITIGGASASGKTYLMTQIAKLYPEHDVEFVEPCSDKEFNGMVSKLRWLR